MSLQILSVEVVDRREVFSPPYSWPGRSGLKVFLCFTYAALAYSSCCLTLHPGRTKHMKHCLLLFSEPHVEKKQTIKFCPGLSHN